MITDYSFISGENMIPPVDTTNYKDYEIIGDESTGHMHNGAAAVFAWVKRTLQTRQMVYPVYSWDHGVDFDQFIGDNYTQELIDAEVQRNITEALMRHPSVTNVSDFEIVSKGDDLEINFKVETIWGDFNANTIQ